MDNDFDVDIDDMMQNKVDFKTRQPLDQKILDKLEEIYNRISPTYLQKDSIGIYNFNKLFFKVFRYIIFL